MKAKFVIAAVLMARSFNLAAVSGVPFRPSLDGTALLCKEQRELLSLYGWLESRTSRRRRGRGASGWAARRDSGAASGAPWNSTLRLLIYGIDQRR